MRDPFIPPNQLETAVLFLVFNRPGTTARVFEQIRRAKPLRLYVASDGPRHGNEREYEQVKEVRDIATAVDWPCEIRTRFQPENVGCRAAVSGAISWFFDQEERGIILEDDCLPCQSFFLFCEALLDKYAADPSVFIISGYNKQNVWKQNQGDYFFSHFGGIWGWATWRRAWAHYDESMQGLEELIEANFFEKRMGSKLGRGRQEQLLRAKQENELGLISAWDFPWAFARHKHGGLACVPSKSLICNIGFGLDATHTKASFHDGVIRHEIHFPLRECRVREPDRKYDELFVLRGSLLKRIIRKLKSLFRKTSK